MVDLRLLSAALLASATLAAGCFTPGKIWFRTIEGQVVDADTGEPVEGAEVFVFYFWAGHLSGTHRFEGSAATDHEGRFLVPGHLGNIIDPPGLAVRDRPYFVVYHREYGVELDSPIGGEWPWRSVVLPIHPDALTMKMARDSKEWGNLCMSVSGDEACKRLCEVAYGAAEKCPPWGEWKR